MIDAFAEGVHSIVQVCHLVIIAPVAMVIIAARGRWQAVTGAVGGIVLGGYVFVTRWIIFTDLQLRLSALLVIAALVVVLLPLLPRARRPGRLERFASIGESSWSVAGLSALVGVNVTLWWRPCVGEELGEILTLAPREPWGQLLPTVGFMLGIAVPLLIIGLIYAAWPPSEVLTDRIALAATGLGIVLATSVVLGQHGEIVARLLQWSQ